MKEGATPSETAVERWDYERQFEEYLLRVAREGKEMLEPIGNFPRRIELNGMWHAALNKMRVATKDGYERWTPIGYKKDMRSVLIPTEFFLGKRNEIPEFSEDQIQEFTQKYSELGLVHFAGDFHSHPRRPISSSLRRFITSGRLLTEYSGFSPRDLKRVADLSLSTFPLHIFGVVDERANFFAFITRQTEVCTSSEHLGQNLRLAKRVFPTYA